MSTSVEIVNRFLSLTAGTTGDLNEAAALLADDVQFASPLMQTPNREAYVGLLRQFMPAHVSTRVLRQFVDGDEVCSINALTLRTPDGGTLTLTMAEWFKLRAGRIAEHTIFYDPRSFAAAFGLQA